MSNKCQIELNKEWVCQRLSDVTDIETQNAAWVLVQEPGFIGFGVVSPNEIWWPPYKPSDWQPDWELMSDLRLFGEKGEWHVWRDWDGKHYARLLEFNEKGEWSIWLGPEKNQHTCPEKSGKKVNTITEHHALWGSDVKPETPRWIKIVEDRGAEVWLPLAKLDLNTKSDLPLRLKLKQIIDYDPKYHLAGIIDAALIGLTKSDKSLLQPPSDMSDGS